jgi:acyl-CoA dehydrogenase
MVNTPSMRCWETDEQAIFREVCRTFMNAEVVPYREEWQAAGRVSRELWEKAGQAGLLCCGISDDYGGGGGTIADEIIVIEELARSLETGFGYPVHSSIVAEYLARYGSEDQKRQWLPDLASGISVAAIAITEPAAGSDMRGVTTRATVDGSSLRITGNKTFISNGGTADLVLILAVTDPDAGSRGYSLLIVDVRELDGFSRGQPFRKIGQKSADTSDLYFDDVVVPSTSLIGNAGDGLHYLMQQLPRERLVIAAGASAAAIRAVELTVDYTKERHLFGTTLFELQNTRFVLAECATHTLAAQVFLDHCIVKELAGVLDNATASMAKWWITDVQCDVIDRCLQFFGGYGYIEDYPIARMYTDARIQKIYGGANEIMKELIARSM